MSRSAVCTVSSYSHLHQVLALARSIRRCWVDQPAIFVALVDHLDEPRPGFEDVGDVHFLSPAELEIPDFNWLSLKFNVGELVCACKPFAIRYVLKNGYDVAWYVDSDMLFMSDPAPMRDLARDHDVVGTPHLVSQLPEREVWTRPTMGDLAGAGVLNAGLFTVRKGEAGLRFLAEWMTMVVGGGACLRDLGLNQDQHTFNWAPALAQDVAVCRDKRMNVAYWNLHERPLRWAHLDGGPKDQWMLDGEPICCFHFSGFDWEHRRLSTHDRRHHVGININLHHLAEYYDACLEAADRKHYGAKGYGRAEIGSLKLTDGIRRHLKLMEQRETLQLDSWSDEGAVLLSDKLMSLPGRFTLLPRLLEDFYLQRADLQALNSWDLLFPRKFFNWCRQYLESACGDQVPLFHSSLLAIHRGMLSELVRRCAVLLPEESETWIADALVHTRSELTAKLCGRKQAEGLIGMIEAGHHLVVATNPVIALRLMMQTWPALFASVPPFGKGDIQVFRERVRQVVAENFIWPTAHGDFLKRLDPEVGLSRLFAVARRHPGLLGEVRRRGLSRELITTLIPWLAGDCDFDATDLALVDWYLDVSTVNGSAPAWRQEFYEKLYGLVYTTPRLYSFVHKTPERVRLATRAAARFLEDDNPKAAPLTRVIRRIVEGAHGNGHATPSSRLLPLLAEEGDEQRWRGYLAWWAAKNKLFNGAQRIDDAALGSLDRLLGSADWKGLGKTFPSMAPQAQGLNIFGYFKSPIGLGQMSRGVAAAHALNGNPHREIVLTNLTMGADFRLEDLYPDFAFHFPRNLAITYPHIDHDLCDLFPARFFRGRETIAYIAWEQRDLHPEWCKRLDPYDRLFALSQFTADSVARATGRVCHALPCVVEMDVARAKAYRRGDFNLPEDAFIAGIVFDASSSVERKNPLAAARALVRAFRGRPDVCVVAKVTNGDRPAFRHVVDELGALFAEAGIQHRLFTKVMPRAEVEGLMAQFDLHVSLHRCEGFGYTIAESMWLGVPVVATGYSGNMDFMSEANSYPVRYRETVVRENEGPFQLGTAWADPDVDHAAALCDQVYGDRKAARAKAAQAEKDVRGMLSIDAVAARLRELLG
jgi:glycosyltransferase involved in cell wall biosynthesis